MNPQHGNKPMKVTGFRLQSALRDVELKKQTAEAEFRDSLTFFAGETKPKPEEMMKAFMEAERKLAKLQEVQTRYNLEVGVVVRLDGKELQMSLQHAIKLVGGASRSEKLWREASGAKGKKSTRDYFRSAEITVRSKDNEYASHALTPTQAAAQIRDASRFVSALREAIQVGNSTQVEMEVPASLFE